MKRSKKIKSYDQNTAITPVEYGGLQVAYDFFNTELFNGELPDVFITYQRRAHSRGYFSPDRFSGRNGKLQRHELALNPDAFIGRTDEDIGSTLGHEMAHVWDKQNGTASTRGYHSKIWAAKMKSIGLQPSSTGAVGGRETGQKMSHYIIPGGPYALAFAKLAATGWKLNLQSAPHAGPNGVRKNKNTFICPTCEQKAYGKPSLAIICKPCGIQMLDRDIAVSPAAPSSLDLGLFFRRGGRCTIVRSKTTSEPVKRKRGRPKGSKNKPAAAAITAEPRRRGRPKGSKNKPKPTSINDAPTHAV